MRVVLTRRESLESPDGVSIFMVSLAQALLELQHEVKIVWAVSKAEKPIRGFWHHASICQSLR